MSVMNRFGIKVLLPRESYDFWESVRRRYPGDGESWRRFAMLALAEDAEWPPDRIARAFDRSPVEVRDCLDQARRELRDHFVNHPSCGFSDPDAPPGERTPGDG